MFHLQKLLLLSTSLVSISVAASFFVHQPYGWSPIHNGMHEIDDDVAGFKHAFLGSVMEEVFEGKRMEYYPETCNQCGGNDTAYRQFFIKPDENCPMEYKSSAPPTKVMLTPKKACKAELVTLCSFCGPIDGVSSLSYVCNYQPSDDCKTYEDIKHGSCMDCS